jgi:hypothetical protein
VDRVALTNELRVQIVADLRQFRETRPHETVYAYGLLGAPSGQPWLVSVIATEEMLQRTAIRYVEHRYRYRGSMEDRPATAEELATWLRWGNPDDGWYHWGLTDNEHVQRTLIAFSETGGLGENAELFEEFCTDVLTLLQTIAEWREGVIRCPVIVGFTYGSDPRDFLRTATRANPYPLVRQLWQEQARANELGRRLLPPDD